MHFKREVTLLISGLLRVASRCMGGCGPGGGGEVSLVELPLSDPVFLDGKRKAGKSKGTRTEKSRGPEWSEWFEAQ